MRLQTLPLILLAVSMALGPLARSADKPSSDKQTFLKSIYLFKKRKYEESRDLLLELVEKKPANALLWFNLGNAQYKLDEYEKAVESYTKVESLRSNLKLAAALYKAKALRALGRSDEAKASLEELLTDYSVPKTLREEATVELGQIQSGAQDETVGGQALTLYKAGRYQEAAALIQGSGSIEEQLLVLKQLALTKLSEQQDNERLGKWSYLDVALGATDNAYLDSDSISEKKPAAVARAGWGLGGRLWREKRWSLDGSYTGDWDETAQVGALKVMTHRLMALANYRGGTSLFQAGPFVEQEAWANQFAARRTGIRTHFRQATRNQEYGVRASVATQVALDSARSYLTGNIYDTRIYFGYVEFPVYGQVFLAARGQETGDQTYSDGSLRPLRNRSWGPGLRAVYRLGKSWALIGQVEYEMKTYTSLALPDKKERKDDTLSSSLRVSRMMDNGLSTYLTVSNRVNNSTLGAADSFSESYKVTTGLLGLTWDIDK